MLAKAIVEDTAVSERSPDPDREMGSDHFPGDSYRYLSENIIEIP